LFVEAIEEEKQEMLMNELVRISQLPEVELDFVLQQMQLLKLRLVKQQTYVEERLNAED